MSLYLLPPTPKDLAELVAIMRSLNLDSERLPIGEFKPITRRIARRLSPDMVSDIVRRYQSGEATTKLNKEYGASRGSLTSLFRGEGVMLRGKSMSQETVDQVVKLYSDDLTIRQVSAKVGHSYSTVRTALKSRSVSIRTSGAERG